jgi:serine/threonine protein phosphatase PrpC
VSIIFAGATDIGRKRKTNQDSICLVSDQKLFVVADGMGGHSGGDIASQMSVKLMPEFTNNHPDLDVPERLKQAVSYVNQSIFDHAQKNSELKGMGTTITSIMFNKNNINIANVGDSRTYLVQNNKLYQLTRDHSMVQEKLSMGIYDRKGAKADPRKNELSRAVGFVPKVEVDIYNYKVSQFDLFLLCSDGLHGKVSDEDIIFIINREIPDSSNANQQDLERLAMALIDQANRNGGQDNISVVLAMAK